MLTKGHQAVLIVEHALHYCILETSKTHSSIFIPQSRAILWCPLLSRRWSVVWLGSFWCRCTQV